MASRVTFTWLWSMVGGLASLVAVVAALWGWGLFPATNGMVQEAQAEILKQVAEVQDQAMRQVAGLEQFSKGTRILTLQADRRYYRDQLDVARAAYQANPTNPSLRQSVRNLEDTLRIIDQQLRDLR